MRNCPVKYFEVGEVEAPSHPLPSLCAHLTVPVSGNTHLPEL